MAWTGPNVSRTQPVKRNRRRYSPAIPNRQPAPTYNPPKRRPGSGNANRSIVANPPRPAPEPRPQPVPKPVDVSTLNGNEGAPDPGVRRMQPLHTTNYDYLGGHSFRNPDDKISNKALAPGVKYGDYEIYNPNAQYADRNAPPIGYAPSFWEDPRHVAQAYMTYKSMAPGEEMPEWLDFEALEGAYKYLSFANGDTPWTNWKYLHPDDPGRGFLQSIAPPPLGEVMNRTDYGNILMSQMIEHPELKTPENMAYLNPHQITAMEYYDQEIERQRVLEEETPFWLKHIGGLMDNPITAGVTQIAPMAVLPLLGGIATAPFTGGASLLPALGSAAMMVASGLGVGYAQTVKYPWLSDAIAGASMLAPIGMGIGGPTGIGIPLGLLGGAAIGALGGMAYGAITGNRAADALMKLFDYGAEYLVERPLGLAIQGAGSVISPEKYGTWEEFLKSFGYAYKAGTMAYDTGAFYKEITYPVYQRLGVDTAENFGGMTREQPGYIWRAVATNPLNMLPYLNELAIKAGLLRGPDNDINDIHYLDADATFQLGISPDPIHLTAVGTAAMVEFRRRLANGENFDKLYLEYQQELGLAGMTSDLAGHMLLDPLNHWGRITKFAVSKSADFAKVLGAPGAADLARTFRLPNVHGLFEGLREHEYLLRRGVYKSVDNMAGWEKNLIGWNDAAKDFNVNLPVESQNPIVRMMDGAWRRTPDAAAIHYVEMASENFAPIAEPFLRDNNIIGLVELLEKFADPQMTPSRAMAELGVKALGSAEWYALKGLVADITPRLRLLAEAYDGATISRMLLNNLSDVTGKSHIDIIADLSKIDTTEGVGKYFNDLLTKTRDDLNIDEGKRKKAGEVIDKTLLPIEDPSRISLDELVRLRDTFTGKDHIASDIGELSAMMVNTFRTRAGEIAATQYKVKPGGKFFLFMNSLKRAQSIVLLGFNPSYVIANAVNNVISTLVSIPGWHTSSANRQLFWAQFGMSPYRLRQGIGLGGIAKDSMKAAGKVDETGRYIENPAAGSEEIRKAGNEPQSLVKAVDKALKKMGKYLPATMASQGLERLQSEVVTYKGTKAMMDALWKHGKEYTPMPDSLRSRLDAVDPSIPKWLDDVIRNNYSIDAMVKDLMSGESHYNLTNAVDVVARNMGIDPKEVDEVLNHYDGVQDAIKNAGNEGGIKEVFRVLREKIDDYLDDMTIVDAEERIREVSARVASGGEAEAFRIMDDLSQTRNFYQLMHEQLMVDAHAKADEIRLAGGTAADVTRHWINTEAKAARWWNRLSYFDYASSQGIFRGLGLEGQGVKDYLGAIAKTRTMWAEFFTQRRDLIREHYRTDFKDAASREAHWAETLKKIDDLYAETNSNVGLFHTTQDITFVALMREKYGDAVATAALEWRRNLAEFNQKKADMNQKERDIMREMRNRGGSDSEQRKEWQRFLKEDMLPLHKEYNQIDNEGLQRMWRIATEQEAPPEPIVTPQTARTTAQEGTKSTEEVVYKPKTAEELSAAIQKVAPSVTPEQADAATVLVSGHAKYLDMSVEDYINYRLAGVAQGGKPAADALFKRFDPEGVNEKEMVKFIRENHEGTDTDDAINKAIEWMTDVMGRRNDESVIHGNQKTFLSGDPTGRCPLLAFGTDCIYCYVNNPREYQKIYAERIGRAGEKVFIGNAPIREYDSAPYDGVLRTMPPDVVKFMNERLKGLRMFSYADFRPEDVPVITRIVEDAASIDLKLKFITKQIDTLKTFYKYENTYYNLSTDFKSEHAYDVLSRSSKELIAENITKISEAHPDWTKTQIKAEATRQADKLINKVATFMRTGRSQVFSGFTVKDAANIKKEYGDRVAIRYVALNKADYISARADPRIDVVTMYHGYTDPAKMRPILQKQKERLYKGPNALGPESMRVIEAMFEAPGPEDIMIGKGLDQKMLDDVLGEGKLTLEEFTNLAWKDCCISGKCGNCPVCCGFSAGDGINIISRFLDGEHRASIEFDQDQKALIRATQSSNITDITHELGHMFRRDLLPSDMEIAAKWAGCKEPNLWTRENEEKFAKGFEQYLQEGKGPTPEMTKVFQMFRRWLLNIYRGLLGQTKEIELDKNIIGVYERMLGSEAKDQALATMQAIREPMPQPGTKSFDEWFYGSKVVDETTGGPLRVFHGTTAEFEKFDINKVGANTGISAFGRGIYFTDNPEYAAMFTRISGAPEGGRVVPVYLSIKNPFKWTAEVFGTHTPPELAKLGVKEPWEYAGFGSKESYSIWADVVRTKLIEAGYDGVVVDSPSGVKEYVVFDPKQIRSTLSDKILGQDALQRYQTDTDRMLQRNRLNTSKDFPEIPEPVPTNQKRTVNIDEVPMRDHVYKMLLEIYKDEPAVARADMALLDARAKEWADMRSDEGFSPMDWYELYIDEIKYLPGESPSSISQVQRYSTQQAVREQIWYSQLERAISDLPQEKLTAAQLEPMLMKAGVKADELEWTGLKEYLETHPKVTRTEILEFAKNNRVKVEEVLKGVDAKQMGWTHTGEHTSATGYKILNSWDLANGSMKAHITELATSPGMYTVSINGTRTTWSGNDISSTMRYAAERIGLSTQEPKYPTYVLPGGENYRELLFTLPSPAKYKTVPMTDFGDRNLTMRVADREGIYESPHWNEDNVLAHVRFNERTVNGKRVLFIEEIQSDWHQAGREKGYRKNVNIAELRRKFYGEVSEKRDKYYLELRNKYGDTPLNKATQEEQDIYFTLDAEWRELNDAIVSYTNGVPAAPWSKTWHEMTMRRMLRWAAENGFDSVAWTTGKQQADRYNLAKYYDKIELLNPLKDTISIYGKRKTIDYSEHITDAPIDRLHEYVGEDIANKYINNKQTVFEGENLSVGSQGMGGFYDKILVDYANKFGKKYKASVGESKIDITEYDWRTQRFSIINDQGRRINYHNRDTALEALGNFREEYPKENWEFQELKGRKTYAPVHSIDVTPEMKASLMGGIPLFQGEKVIKGVTIHRPDTTKKIIYAFKSKDQSTMIHEFSHIWFEDGAIPLTDRLILIDWFEKNGVKGFEFDANGIPVKTNEAVWRDGHELFAKGWERYLAEGKAPIPALQPVFDRFKRWMINIYYSLFSNIDPADRPPDLTPEVREVFARMLGGDQKNKSMGDMPPDLVETLAPSLYTSQVESEGYHTYGRDILDNLERVLIENGPTGPSRIPENLQPEVRKYLKTIDGDLATAKAAAMGYGIKIRDNAMLDYTDQRGFDKYANLAFPYQYWYTRSMLNWAMRMYDRPSWFANYYRLREFMQSAQAQSTFPSRLKNKATWPAPYLPDWAGGSFYFDPLNNIFPFENFGSGLSRYQSDVTAEDRAAIGILYDMEEAGEITRDEVKDAIQKRAGDVWEKALTQAKDGNKLDLFEMISLAQTPALWIGYLYNLLKGTPEKITTLPITRTGQALQAATEGSTGALPQLGNWIGKALAGPETAIRNRAGLSEFGEWGPYYIDRMLANMVADGSAPLKDAQIAMIEKTGPVYEEARRRVMLELAFKVPGAAPIYAASHMRSDNPWVNAEDIGSALMFGLYPATILPKGELIQRGLYEEYKSAGARYKAGDGEAYQKFYEDHPEYNARLALYKSPEGRMKSFLVSEIWDAWMELGSAERQLAKEDLGPEFQENFIEDPTNDYDLVDVQTLAGWSKMLGMYVPKTTEMESINNDPDLNLTALNSAPPEELAEVNAYRQIRSTMFPNHYALGQRYFGLPEGQPRQAFLARFPELKDYWDWNKAYKAQHPAITKYSSSSTSSDVQYDLSFVTDLSPVVLRQLYAYFYADRSLSDGAIAEMNRIWELHGSQGEDFQNFIDVIVRSAIAPEQ